MGSVADRCAKSDAEEAAALLTARLEASERRAETMEAARDDVTRQRDEALERVEADAEEHRKELDAARVAAAKAARECQKLTVALDVGSGLTLGELSLAIMAQTNINPRDQRLLKNGVEVVGSGRTLFECRITPECELEVVYTEDHQGNDDLADLLDSGGQGGGKPERGFAGTALTL